MTCMDQQPHLLTCLSTYRLPYYSQCSNYRACVGAHTVALQAQRRFWLALLHDTIHFKTLQSSFKRMSMAEKQAASVYHRILGRYANNGRLLRAYGRFLEYVKVRKLVFGW